MDLVPVRCMGNSNKRYDDKVWWEEVGTIVEVNDKPVNKVLKSDLKNGDNVMIKFGGKGKAKKLFKGIIEFPAPTDVDTPNLLEHTSSPRKPKSPSKSKSPLKMSVQPAAKKQKLGPDKLKSG